MATTRQLAAILFTDIEGYTALMQKDEQKAMAAKDRHREVFQKTHQQYNGRIIRYYGDGTLSTFQSAVDAVKCAVAMQQAFLRSPSIPVRMGLHAGEIMMEDDDVFGDGINLASRIESLGVSGSVLLSDKVQEQLHNQPNIKTVSVGKYHLKNIERIVEVFAVSDAGLIVPPADSLKGKTAEKQKQGSKKIFGIPVKWALAAASVIIMVLASYFILKKDKKNITADNTRRIAVLPFRNISKDAGNEYLSDGITEELISTLAGIADLKVISRTSILQYKTGSKSMKQIGKELNISALIDGSVIKDGNNLRINTQLIDTKTDEILWSDNFEKTTGELLIFYSQIVQQVAHRLDVTLKDVEISRLKKAEKVNPELHQLYLKGLFYNNKFTLDNYQKAIRQFDLALQIEPNYAPALAGKALSYSLMGVFNPAISITEALPKTLKSAEKALAIDSSLAVACIAIGYAQMFFQRDLNRAEQSLMKANRIAPSNDATLTALILVNLYKGNADSAAYWLQKGKIISPFSFWLTHQEGRVLYIQNKKNEAFEVYKNAIAIYDHIILYDHLSNLYNQSGMYKESMALLETAMVKFSDIPASSYAWLAEDYFKTGNKEKAKKIIHDMEDKVLRKVPNYAFFTAACYAGIGEKEKAFYFLDKAIELNDVDLLWLKQDSHFSSIKDDPRFAVYLKKAGF
jgi:adenylate cyclase